ncbi:MAG: VacJ family lipoprotein [Alphaproteobacteria bacterium]|nr:VacJ family lipoprotein [Alphaproteobacteria bacterium]
MSQMARLIIVATAGLALAGCTTPRAGRDSLAPDPWEKTNRSIYSFNRSIDKAVVTPATKAYRAVLPQAAQRGIRNVFNLASQPLSFVNSVLQGKPKQAMRTAGRFAINATIGVGGLADHASDMGVVDEPEDFGQTLAVWGVKSGPYVMLPFFGPSSVRDTLGFGLDQVADPFDIQLQRETKALEYYAIRAVSLLDTRSFLLDTADSLLRGSADEYATVRSAYLQLRENQIYDGNPPQDEDEVVPLGADEAAATEPSAAEPAAATPAAEPTPATDAPAQPQ